MTTEQVSTLVFKNDAGDYFLLPLETLEQGRVPVERKAEVEQLIAEANDVQGHVLPALYGLAFLTGLGIGMRIGDEIRGAGGQAGDIGRQAAALGAMGKGLSNTVQQ